MDKEVDSKDITQAISPESRDSEVSSIGLPLLVVHGEDILKAGIVNTEAAKGSIVNLASSAVPDDEQRKEKTSP
jgi:hypothetical protein